MIPRIASEAAALREKLVAIRREFHMYPELSGEEAQTAQKVAQHLQILGLEVHTAIGGHGLVGMLHGLQPGPTVAYRADMDALPVQDALETAYRSLAMGVKHACGHDAHMTIALGAAEVLADLREDLAGSIAFIFQPAEEALDGAKAMLADHVLDIAQNPQAIFAFHTFPIPVGQVGISPGLVLPGMDEFRVRFFPSEARLEDLISETMKTLSELSTVTMPANWQEFNAVIQTMRESDFHNRTVVVSCWVQPLNPQHDHVMILVSAPDSARQLELHEQIQHTLQNVCETFGGRFALHHSFTNPPVINDVALVRQSLPWLKSVVGKENVLHFQSSYPFAHEDFTLYQALIPGVFLWLGTANEERSLTHILHQPAFDIDEDALVIGTRLAATLLAQFLQSRGSRRIPH